MMTIKQHIRMLEKHMNNLFPNLNIHFYVSKGSKFLGVPFGIGFLVTKGSGIGFLEFQVFNPCCKNLVPHFCCKKIFFFDPGRICYPSGESNLILCCTGWIDLIFGKSK